MRVLGRKLCVAVEERADLHLEIAGKVAALEDGGSEVKTLQRREGEARNDYVAIANRVGERRRSAAKALDAAVAKELKPLKLDKARFATVLPVLPEAEWAEWGAERVHFE